MHPSCTISGAIIDVPKWELWESARQGIGCALLENSPYTCLFRCVLHKIVPEVRNNAESEEGAFVEACPTDAITHELATYDINSLVYRKEQLLEPWPPPKTPQAQMRQ